MTRRAGWVIGTACFLWLTMVTVGLPIYFHITAHHPSPTEWATYQQQLNKWNNSAGFVACAHARDQQNCFGNLQTPQAP